MMNIVTWETCKNKYHCRPCAEAENMNGQRRCATLPRAPKPASTMSLMQHKKALVNQQHSLAVTAFD
jgi:hypothetical protein